ncbi:TPA: tol-pal system YbgF family protein, partial [Salmonella enterica subsp. enterica serovar Typhimurium]
NDAYMHNKVAEAWFNTGIVYYEMGRPELSALYWEKIVDRYAKSANQTNMTVVRKAEVNMGQISMLLNENSTFRTISNQQ